MKSVRKEKELKKKWRRKDINQFTCIIANGKVWLLPHILQSSNTWKVFQNILLNHLIQGKIDPLSLSNCIELMLDFHVRLCLRGGRTEAIELFFNESTYTNQTLHYLGLDPLAIFILYAACSDALCLVPKPQAICSMLFIEIEYRAYCIEGKTANGSEP